MEVIIDNSGHAQKLDVVGEYGSDHLIQSTVTPETKMTFDEWMEYIRRLVEQNLKTQS